MGLFSGAKAVASSLRRMASDAGVPVQTETLTEDLRHRDTPVLAELNWLLSDPTYTPEQTVDPEHPAIVCHGAASRQAEAKAGGGGDRRPGPGRHALPSHGGDLPGCGPVPGPAAV